MKKKIQGPVPIADFGRDHWSTFAYVETLCVDKDGIPDRRRMRCHPQRHALLAHLDRWDKKYGTRLKGHMEDFPKVLPMHDDWDCIDDLIAAGLMRNKGTGINPVFQLTEWGLAIAAALRAHKVRGGTFSTFDHELEPKKRSGWGFKYGKARLFRSPQSLQTLAPRSPVHPLYEKVKTKEE